MPFENGAAGVRDRPALPPLQYELLITVREPNPDFKPARGGQILRQMYGGEEGQPAFLREEVTKATLTADQWRRVQRAIIEALDA